MLSSTFHLFPSGAMLHHVSAPVTQTGFLWFSLHSLTSVSYLLGKKFYSLRVLWAWVQIPRRKITNDPSETLACHPQSIQNGATPQEDKGLRRKTGVSWGKMDVDMDYRRNELKGKGRIQRCAWTCPAEKLLWKFIRSNCPSKKTPNARKHGVENSSVNT